MKSKLFAVVLPAFVLLPLSGCVVQRTVTDGGQTVEQGYAIKRPVKTVLENSR